MIQFTNTTLEALGSWRDQYFDSLPLSQDMYSESMISWMPGVICYAIIGNDVQFGYVILNSSNELVELYIHQELLTQKEVVFSELINQLEIKNAYCKSFDYVLLSCCHAFVRSSKIAGYLFQDYEINTNIVQDNAIKVRLATMDDISFLNRFENELLDEGEKIDAYVENNCVYMFMKETKLIGCGYLFNIVPGRKHYDVGMWINQPYRLQGYGTGIISYLMKYCRDNGFIPTAGCEESNVASRRTLEKCGFVSKYCLINFEL